MRTSIQAQYIAKRSEFLGHSGRDASTISREAIEIFDRKWADEELRLHIVPGKRVLSDLFSRVQMEYKVNLTTAKIIEQLHQNEVARDLRQALLDVDAFRRQVP